MRADGADCVDLTGRVRDWRPSNFRLSEPPGTTICSMADTYFLRLAAFHFAQRARCAAAILSRAAADMVFGFLPEG